MARRELLNWASAVGGAQHSGAHSLAPSSLSAPFPVPQPVPGAGGRGLGFILKEHTIHGWAGLKIILVYRAECWDETGASRKGWRIRPEAGDFEGCLEEVALCQNWTLCVPVFGKDGVGLARVEWDWEGGKQSG